MAKLFLSHIRESWLLYLCIAANLVWSSWDWLSWLTLGLGVLSLALSAVKAWRDSHG